MPTTTTPTLTRQLGRSDRFTLSLQGVRFELSTPDLYALAQSLTRVLASVARDQEQSHA